MKSAENFTWIGPLSSDDCAGRIAREFVAGLARAGARVAALDTGDGACDTTCDLDAEVRPDSTTVVRQARLSTLAATEAIVPFGRAAKDVAYVVVDVPEIATSLRAFLERCDEIWVPNMAQGEILAALRVPRAKLHVVAPAVDIPAASNWRSHAQPRIVVVGGPPRTSGNTACSDSSAPVGSRAFEAEIAAADSVVLCADPDPWGHTALALAASGKLHLCVASGAVLEFAQANDCAWLTPADALAPERLEKALVELARDFRTRREIAARASARLSTLQSPDALARALLERHTHPRRLERESLGRVLADLGLPTPDERLASSRPLVEIVPVEGVEGPWITTLQKRIGRAREDTTIVVWIDEALAADADRVTAHAETALTASGRAPTDVDVLVIVAPLAHAPSEHLVTLAA